MNTLVQDVNKMTSSFEAKRFEGINATVDMLNDGKEVEVTDNDFVVGNKIDRKSFNDFMSQKSGRLVFS